MKNLPLNTVAGQTLQQLSPAGAFLTVKVESKINTMTIGWGSVGIIWGKPIFTALVHPARYTYTMIESAKEFTVSVPTSDPLRDALLFAGTKSGRDMDKFSGHGLTAAPGQVLATPIVAECGLHFECRTLLAQEMNEEKMSEWMKSIPLYKKTGEYHTLYFAEIVACYTTDE